MTPGDARRSYEEQPNKSSPGEGGGGSKKMVGIYAAPVWLAWSRFEIQIVMACRSRATVNPQYLSLYGSSGRANFSFQLPKTAPTTTKYRVQLVFV